MTDDQGGSREGRKERRIEGRRDKGRGEGKVRVRKGEKGRWDRGCSDGIGGRLRKIDGEIDGKKKGWMEGERRQQEAGKGSWEEREVEGKAERGRATAN